MVKRKKYNAKRDIPLAIEILKTTSPTAIREWIRTEKETLRTVASISKWINDPRHEEQIAEIVKRFQIKELEYEVVDESIFKSGTFEMYPKVRLWDLSMGRFKIQNRMANIATLKRICQGIKPAINPKTHYTYRKGERKLGNMKGIDLKEYGWITRHPENITIDHFLEWENLMIEHFSKVGDIGDPNYLPSVDTSAERMAFRNFMIANGVNPGKRISGQKHKSAGVYKRLYFEKPKLNAVFEDLIRTDFEAYVVDMFMFKTGTRISATLNALLENIFIIGDRAYIEVFDKGVRRKYEEGKPWEKYLSKDMLEDIKALTGYPRVIAGKIFPNKTDQEMSDINQEMLKKHIPELWVMFPRYNDHNHFWRHMFAQHLLRATNWNYGIVAGLGGWDVKSLEESYGAMNRESLLKIGAELIPNL